MKQDQALRLLAEIMGWSNEVCSREYAWLRLISRLKYDSYRDYSAGVLFVESLADWLQQFAVAERQAAYDFVRQHLIFLSPPEMQHLVDLFYPEIVRDRLVGIIAERRGLKPHQVWGTPGLDEAYRSLLRRTLFLGLSDGARMDSLRRSNTGVISNEQVMIATELEPLRWASAVKKLRKETGDLSAKFEVVYLIDDFAGSGKTFLRSDPESAEGWDGKLVKFRRTIMSLDDTFADGWALCVHHYVASHEASTGIPATDAAARAALTSNWFNAITFTFGTVLPPTVKVGREQHGAFMDLVEKYYDPSIQSSHTDVGGTADVRLGFGACALPLVLEHNTPNNSVALLWAETDGEKGTHPMRPLFRRRQRHS
jgi:hypothetical protein